ncbi:putative dimethyl sulfoxide reductase iron-sulfur subunit B [Nymphon striatum]|nr:putative dimethyl sulfoxide reductase iron-sulfur subunit B [Nymphon striatum]
MTVKRFVLDKGFSWEYPLSVHGLMHNAITNAWRGDPYPVDTLMLFMANMAWNSSMNTTEVRKMLVDKDEEGEYKIPFIIVADAYHSETVDFGDLILPDTSYLERHDAMSMLDRPYSEYDGPVDAVTYSSVATKRIIVTLVINFETAPGSGIGFLAGWRGKSGEKSMKGEPNPNQWEMYKKNDCVFHYEMPKSYQYMRNWNRAQGKTKGRQPPDRLRKRVETYFDPLPFHHEPLEVTINGYSKALYGPGMQLVKHLVHGGLDAKANESNKGFLLNHVISEELPAHDAGEHVSNSDPVTGQAGWYDVRVRVYKASENEAKHTLPKFDTVKPLPGMEKKRKKKWQGFVAGCHACVTSCKEWNTSGEAGPMVDKYAYGENPTVIADPACVMSCPTSARLFGDVHDENSEVSIAIRESAGYQLMPEWGTKPANHYLPRRKTKIKIHKDELERVDNPLSMEERLTHNEPGTGPSLDDMSNW